MNIMTRIVQRIWFQNSFLALNLALALFCGWHPYYPEIPKAEPDPGSLFPLFLQIKPDGCWADPYAVIDRKGAPVYVCKKTCAEKERQPVNRF
ncbi:MAG: hypothetical protein R6V54_12985 [Desulfobacteraceae bacterium]